MIIIRIRIRIIEIPLGVEIENKKLEGMIKEGDQNLRSILVQLPLQTLTPTLTLNKIYFDINEKDKQQEIDNIIT